MSPMPSPPSMKRDPLRIEICRDAEDLARHAAAAFVSIAGMAFGSRSRFEAALAGGEAAGRMYDVLAGDNLAYQIVWPAVHVFFSDELCVPRDDPRSRRNQTQAFLARTGVPAANIHPIRGEEGAAKAIAFATDDLRGHFKGGPRLDLVVLDARDILTAPPGAEEGGALYRLMKDADGIERVALTSEALRYARAVMVLASGGSIAVAARDALGAGRLDDARVRALTPVQGQLLWLLDAQAASLLPLPDRDAGTERGPLEDLSGP